MKHLLLTTIAAVVLVGCGESQQSSTTPETKPVEPVAEAASPKPPKSKPLTPKRLLKAAKLDDIELVKEHLAAGVDVNTKDKVGWLFPFSFQFFTRLAAVFAEEVDNF